MTYSGPFPNTPLLEHPIKYDCESKVEDIPGAVTIENNAFWRYRELSDRIAAHKGGFSRDDILASNACVNIIELLNQIDVGTAGGAVTAQANARTVWHSLYDQHAGEKEISFYLGEENQANGALGERRSDYLIYTLEPFSGGAVHGGAQDRSISVTNWEKPMSLTTLLALITAVIVIVKLLMVRKSQGLWFNTVTSRYWKGSGTVTMLLSLVAASIALVILLQELTIVQIWACLFFSMALVSMALAPFAKYMLEAEKNWFAEENVLKKGWVPLVVWVGFSVWVLIAILRDTFG